MTASSTKAQGGVAVQGHDAAGGAGPGEGSGAGQESGGRPAAASWLRLAWRKLREGGALMVGVPDYDRYVVHMRAQHPELPPMTREAFVRARMEARYGGKGTGKCPC